MFEGYQADATKDVDTKRFSISNGMNIKRTEKKFGQVCRGLRLMHPDAFASQKTQNT